MTRLLRRLLCALAPILAAPLPAAAEDLSRIVTVEMLPGWRGEDGRHMAGLHIRLAPGWKTYWRAPGDAGIPPVFDWAGSENLGGVAFHWPVPQVSWQNGMRSIGYSGEVTLPIEVALADPGAPARLSGRVLLGVCEEVCIPVELSFDTRLPVAADGARSPLIVAAMVDRPLTGAEAGVGAVTCAAETTPEGLRLTVTAALPPRHRGEVAVIETADPEVWVSEPEVSASAEGIVAVADLAHVAGAPVALDRSGVRLTVIAADGGAVDIRGCTAG